MLEGSDNYGLRLVASASPASWAFGPAVLRREVSRTPVQRACSYMVGAAGNLGQDGCFGVSTGVRRGGPRPDCHASRLDCPVTVVVVELGRRWVAAPDFDNKGAADGRARRFGAAEGRMKQNI